MTDDLKERLKKWPTPLHGEALARITDLEARLAAAEAGEDALASTGENFAIAIGMGWDLEGVIDAFKAALDAYEARRKG